MKLFKLSCFICTFVYSIPMDRIDQSDHSDAVTELSDNNTITPTTATIGCNNIVLIGLF